MLATSFLSLTCLVAICQTRTTLSSPDNLTTNPLSSLESNINAQIPYDHEINISKLYGSESNTSIPHDGRTLRPHKTPNMLDLTVTIAREGVKVTVDSAEVSNSLQYHREDL